MISPFESSREHLNTELARLDLLIQREIWRWRQAGAPQSQSEEEFRGLYVSEAEVDAILGDVYPGSVRVAQKVAGQRTEEAFRQAIERAAASIEARKAASAKQGIRLRLEQLRSLFSLSTFDVDALLVCLAPELELHYERLYAYLQDDMTRRRPGVAMILNLLCAASDERLAARLRFAPDAPLLRHQLLTLFGDPAQPYPPLLAQYAKPDPRLVDYVLEEGDRQNPSALDARLRDFSAIAYPTTRVETLLLPSGVKAQLARLIASGHQEEPSGPTTLLRPALILFQGDDTAAKHAAAQAACAAWAKPLLTVHLSHLLGQNQNLKQSIQLAAREAYLAGGCVYWHDYDLLIPKRSTDDAERALWHETFYAALLEYPLVSFISMRDAERQPDQSLLHAPCLVRVTFRQPSYSLRRALWTRFIQEHETAPAVDLTAVDLAAVDLAAVAGRFRLTTGQIQDAVMDAHHRAVQRPQHERTLTTDDLFAAARARTSEQLLHLAKKIVPLHTWDDLVLPPDQLAQLRELCDQMMYRPVVLGDWGFGRKLSLGKGLNVLFAGPSGTGKTMAAEVIAGDLGLELFKIDLSTIVSKYVGETEKNLERIFRAARNSNAILFFDEADALFGKRSEVRDAHDRYANVEISYLLQKMEEYDGLVILTTNLSKNMDEAFARRMSFTVDFPYPREEARWRIWQTSFPDQAPLSPDVDLRYLADRYRLTGGNIRNVVLTAAFLAARDGGVITMDHLLWATRREFQKMGRLADEREFEVR